MELMKASADPELPDGWSVSMLEDIGVLYCGQSPATNFVNTKREGTPYITGPDQWDGDQLHVDKWTTDPRRTVPGGCIFVTVKGAGVGTIFPGVPGAIGRDVYAFKPATEVSDSFVRRALEFTVSEIKRNAAGDIPGLSKDHLLKHLVNVPPREEQERIIAAIDQLFVLSKSARDHLSRVPAILKRFRQAVLAAAYSGRLTATSRQEHDTAPWSDTVFETVLEPPYDLPASWRWVKWKDLVVKAKHSFKRGPFGSALKKESFVTRGYKVYEQCCPINDDCSLGRYYVTEEKYKELEAFKVNAGDLLISCSGVTLGRITRVSLDFEPGIINQALLKVTLDESVVLPDYFIRFFRSDFFQRLIFENVRGSAIPNVRGAKELKELPIPLAPVPEQQQIVDRVDELIDFSSRIEDRHQSALKFTNSLAQSILAKAFRGELVPTEAELARREGREYEPASVLLDRIKKEREKETKPNKRSRKLVATR